jgi:hypothetical protein
VNVEEFTNEGGFAARDLRGMDRWETFTPVFGSLTVVGAENYTGRLRIIGRSVEGQVRFSAATSIASVAGTDYLNLPIYKRDLALAVIPAGLAGFGVMTNDTTNVAVGLCHLDVTTARLYLPTQGASASVFNLYFTYEI